MPGPITQAGGAAEPSEYASLTMDTQFTGIWTQRSPFRDAAVPYLYRKFYSASRFDSIIDGLNREISSKLTDIRRPGCSVYNSNTFPGANSMFAFKWIQNNAQQIRLLYDGQDGTIYDATAGQKTAIFTKSGTAGKARFASIGSNLYFSDGTDLEKILACGTAWTATTNISPGTLINTAILNGNIQMALGGMTLPIVATQALSPSGYAIYIDPQQIPLNFPNLVGINVTFSGLTGLVSLNGTTVPVTNILSSTLGIFAIGSAPHSAGAVIADTGQASTGNGTTGASVPSFSNARYGITADAGQQWKCYGSAIQNWGLAKPTKAPTLIAQATGVRWWQPSASVANLASILDNNQNVQLINGSSAAGVTGRNYPKFSTVTAPSVFQSGAVPFNSATPTGYLTLDGSASWTNCGPIQQWIKSTVIPQYSVILDSNNNLQVALTPGTTGGSAPVWNSAVGSTTTDNTVTWTCLGPGYVLTTASRQYAFSTHAVDGSVSTASLVATVQGPVLGPVATTFTQYIKLIGTFTDDTQIDQIWIWRTAQGQSTLILEDQLGLDAVASGSTFIAFELGIPDTSTAGAGSLNALVAAPIANANNPPPAGLTAPEFHNGSLWGFVGSVLYQSGGGGTVVGNGATAWSPLSFWQLPEQLTRLKAVTIQNGGLIVFGISNAYVVLGQGIPSNPYLPPKKYMAGVGVRSYTEIDERGTSLYIFTNRRKVISWDPANAEQEIGFPIGDQFLKVTTGGINSTLYLSGSTFVTWHESDTTDTALYVSDGAVGWFRWTAIAPPESGFLWSPRAAIVGGTSAVQSIETTPGNFQLLIAPATPGPILFRDATTNADNGTAYPAYDVKGSIGLCETGEIAEIAHIALKSTAVGARPTVSILLDEIQAGVTVEGRTSTWDVLELDPNRHEDPPDLASSITVYSDRYQALANGGGSSGDSPQGPKCENFQLKVDYGTQNVADELLKFAVFGAVFKERVQR